MAIRCASFFAVQFLIARRGAFFPIQSGVNTVFNKDLSGPLNGHATNMKSLMNLLIGPPWALWTLIGLQKNTGSRQFVSCRFPFGKQG